MVKFKTSGIVLMVISGIVMLLAFLFSTVFWVKFLINFSDMNPPKIIWALVWVFGIGGFLILWAFLWHIVPKKLEKYL